MSRLAAFLHGDGIDDAGRRVAQVLASGDRALEEQHDFIQWLFPLREPSRAVAAAPVLLDEDVRLIREDAGAQANLRTAAERMLAFYRDTRGWRDWSDHNHLRITRIVRSLRLLVDDDAADAFRDGVLALAGPSPAINPRTLEYWAAA